MKFIFSLKHYLFTGNLFILQEKGKKYYRKIIFYQTKVFLNWAVNLLPYLMDKTASYNYSNSINFEIVSRI